MMFIPIIIIQIIRVIDALENSIETIDSIVIGIKSPASTQQMPIITCTYQKCLLYRDILIDWSVFVRRSNAARPIFFLQNLIFKILIKFYFLTEASVIMKI